MKEPPVDRQLMDNIIRKYGITDFPHATIRAIKAVATKAEAVSGVEFVKMEMGVSGLPPSSVGAEAEIASLRQGMASLYPDINEEAIHRQEASQFVRAFVGVEVEGCVPGTDSMQGMFAAFLTCLQCYPDLFKTINIKPEMRVWDFLHGIIPDENQNIY